MEDATGPVDARLRALQLWDANGFDELSVGLMFCVLGGALLLGVWASWTITPLLMLAFALPMGFAIKRVRARFVFPRTGYVVFRSAPSRKWIILGFLAFGALFTAVDCLWRPRPDFSRAWGPAWGLVFAAIFVWSALAYKIPRYLWIAGLSLVLGGATFAIGAKGEGVIWVMLGIGAAMALEGALRLKHFLRTHPIAEDRGEEQHG